MYKVQFFKGQSEEHINAWFAQQSPPVEVIDVSVVPFAPPSSSNPMGVSFTSAYPFHYIVTYRQG